MKKIIATILLVTMSLSLCGCSFWQTGGGNGFDIFSLFRSEEPEFTITFDMNYPEAMEEIQSQIVKSGEKATPVLPQRDAHIFAGWYMDPDFSSYFDFENQEIEQDYVLYARWLEDDSGESHDYSSQAFQNDEVLAHLIEENGGTCFVNEGILYMPLHPFVKETKAGLCWKQSGNPLEANTLMSLPYAILKGADTIKFFHTPSGMEHATDFLNGNYKSLYMPIEVFKNSGHTLKQINEKLGISLRTNYQLSDTLQVSETSQGAVTKATLDCDFLTNEGTIKLTTVPDERSVIATTAGKLGAVVRVDTPAGVLGEGVLTLSYDPAALGGAKEENLKLAYYNATEDKVELCSGVNLDAGANTLSASVGGAGEYIVVDGAKWAEVWAKQQLLIREEGEDEFYNIAFVLDISGSMGNSIELLKKATTDFIDALYPEDFVSVTTFETNSSLLISGKYVQDITPEDRALIQSVRSTGGTNMYAGLDTAQHGMVGNYYDSRWASYKQLMIVLSDGATQYKDKVLDLAKRYGENETQIIALALGNSSDVELMKSLANATNGIYQYIHTAEDIQEVFELIRGASIGLETDTDGDGIPDLIETTGMRDQYGSLYMTNPNVADTDGDGYSDGEEMGILIRGDYAYFKRKSDPNISSDFQNKAKVVLDEKDISVSMVPDQYGVAQVSFTLDYLHFEDFLTQERVYESPKKISVNLLHEPCMEFLSSSKQKLGENEQEITLNGQLIGNNGMGKSELVKAYFRCSKGHRKKHTLKISCGGSNFETVEQEVTIDFKKIMEEYEAALQQDYDRLVAQAQKESEEKINQELKKNPLDDSDERQRISEVFDKYFIIASDGGMTEDELYAVKDAVLTYMAENKCNLKIEKDDDDVGIVHKVERYIYNLQHEETGKYPVIVNGTSYEVSVDYSMVVLTATVGDKTLQFTRSAAFAEEQMEGLKKDLEAVYQESEKNVKKELAFLVGDFVFNDVVMDKVDSSLLEYLNKINPDIAKWLKIGVALEDSTNYGGSGPNFGKIKSHCDDILKQDFTPNTKSLAKKIIGKIEQIANSAKGE